MGYRTPAFVWRGSYLYVTNNPHAVERLVPRGNDTWGLPDGGPAMPLNDARLHAEEMARKRRRLMGALPDPEQARIRALAQLDKAIGVLHDAGL